MAMVGIFELLIVGVVGFVILAVVGGLIYFIIKKNQPVTPSGTVCPHCGSSNPAENKFCGSCGKVL